MTNPPPHNSITGCECSNYIYVRAFGRTTSRLTGTNERDSSNSSRTRLPDCCAWDLQRKLAVLVKRLRPDAQKI